MSEHTHGKLRFKTQESALEKKNKDMDKEIKELKRRIDNIRRITPHLKPWVEV